MTQPGLDFAAPTGNSLCDRLARYFIASEGRWIDGLALAKVAGSYGWRSRCSDLRKPPYGFTIENRQTKRVNLMTGQKYKVSEYRLVVPSPAVVSGSGGEKTADCQ